MIVKEVRNDELYFENLAFESLLYFSLLQIKIWVVFGWNWGIHSQPSPFNYSLGYLKRRHGCGLNFLDVELCGDGLWLIALIELLLGGALHMIVLHTCKQNLLPLYYMP